MISVQEAFDKIQSEVETLSPIIIEIEDAIDYIVHSEINSPIDLPPFNQSAMDGYAICGNNLDRFDLVGEIQAGDSGAEIVLLDGQAVRIFTGAIVPKGATAVAKQETVERLGNIISLNEPVEANKNIRPKGEQTKKGDIAFLPGTKLNAGSAGFLYALGMTNVKVVRKPKVVIIATGNELISPGKPLTSGKIYESNTYMLKTALKVLGIDAKIKTVEDDFLATKKTIEEALSDNDILITTGGISVGDYDFVGKAMNELGVKSIFYKVKQKPGKPVFFGKYNSKTVFGLPGNPAAALSCFYMYITPAIRKMMGYEDVYLEKRKLALTSEYKKTNSLSHFLKAKAYGNNVTILNAQSSAMLSSFAEANCLIHMEESIEEWKVGDIVDAYILP